MENQLLPDQQRLEAIHRLCKILEPAPAEEALTLATAMLAQILWAHRVEPHSEQWSRFFWDWQTAVAAQVRALRDGPQPPLN
jgi:hypothetical protein